MSEGQILRAEVHQADVPHFSRPIYAPTSAGAGRGVGAHRHVQQVEDLLL